MMNRKKIAKTASGEHTIYMIASNQPSNFYLFVIIGAIYP